MTYVCAQTRSSCGCFWNPSEASRNTFPLRTVSATRFSLKWIYSSPDQGLHNVLHYFRVTSSDFGYHMWSMSQVSSQTFSCQCSQVDRLLLFLTDRCFSCSLVLLWCALWAGAGKIRNIMVAKASCLDLAGLVGVWSGTCCHRNSLWSASKSTHLHLKVPAIGTCVDRSRGDPIRDQ